MTNTNEAAKHGRRPFGEMVDSLIARVMKNLREKEMKGSVTDLIRASELEREMFPPKQTPNEVIWLDRSS